MIFIKFLSKILPDNPSDGMHAIAFSRFKAYAEALLAPCCKYTLQMIPHSPRAFERGTCLTFVC